MSDPILRIQDLGLSIGGAKILEGINLEVKPNEILGIIGPNGAGKTSLFNLLSGLRAPTRGSIEFSGRGITKYTPAQRARAGIARTFQTSSIFTNLTVLENVRIAAHAALENSFRLTRSAYKYNSVLKHANECLTKVGLSGESLSLAGSLSHGDKRRLEIAIVLATNSTLVLLDEPMAGMAVESVPALVEIIRSLKTEHGKTVLLVEHHMDVVLGLADRIAVLNYGELLVCDTPENVMRNPVVQSAYLGESL